MIIVKNKRSSIEKIKQEYPGCHIFDVTSKGEMQKLSPFYPHGGIQVNFVGGGKDGSAAQEPSQCRQLRRMGVNADIFFDSNENHFIMVNRRADMMKFLKRRWSKRFKRRSKLR